MKTQFIKMFNYDQFANDALIQAITESHIHHKPLQLLAHLLSAQHIWLDRVNNIVPYAIDLWPKDFTAEHCRKLINEYHEEWLIFLDKQSETDLDKIITYKTSTGDDYQTELKDILTHVINHGTHTRAQAGQQLKLAGAQTLPITDYVYYLRQLNSKH